MKARLYATPIAFKQALEQRLRSFSSTGIDFARRRQLLVFDRFLARVTQVPSNAVILKGGVFSNCGSPRPGPPKTSICGCRAPPIMSSSACKLRGA